MCHFSLARYLAVCGMILPLVQNMQFDRHPCKEEIL